MWFEIGGLICKYVCVGTGAQTKGRLGNRPFVASGLRSGSLLADDVGMKRAFRKAARTLLQVTASGAMTALISAIAGGLHPSTAAIVLAAWTVVLTYIQNALEGQGVIGTLLPSPTVLVPNPAIIGAREVTG